MKNLSPLQIIIMAIFIVSIIVATLIFSGVLPGFKDKSAAVASITYWDTINKIEMNGISESFSKEYGTKINYREIKESEYLETVVNALASGEGPDVWRVSNDLLLKNIPKIVFIPFTTYPERTYREKFLDEASLLIFPQGLAGIPADIDPIVLYWNRALFRSASIASAPKTWNQFLSASEKLTRFDGSKNIIQSGAALGDFSNVNHAKDIFSLLIMQSGNPLSRVVAEGKDKNLKVKMESAFGELGTEALPAVESSIRFFNDFSDPKKSSYSWTPSLPNALEHFNQGKLAMYIGYGSEYNTIKEKNPHLDFDIAEIPQISETSPAMTFGRMNVYVISRQSSQPKQTGALIFINYMTSSGLQNYFPQRLSKAPVLRQTLATPPDNAALSVIYSSAIKAVSWLEPDPNDIYNLFKDMARQIASGQKNARKAVGDTHRILESLYQPLLIK